MKTLVRNILRSRGYDIVKTSRWYSLHRPKGPWDVYETATGDYYLPRTEGDCIKTAIESDRVFEKEIVDEASKYITSTGSVLDIGANFGQMSVLFSRMTLGNVYSFEAEPEVATYLRANIALNRLTNVRVIEGAVWNLDGQLVFYPPIDFERSGTYGSYGVKPRATSGHAPRTLTIDSLRIQEPISFMKVDVQGSDLFAMQGAVNTIRQNRMPIIFEYEEQFQQDFGTSFQDYVDFVHSINYRFLKTILGINYLIVPK